MRVVIDLGWFASYVKVNRWEVVYGSVELCNGCNTENKMHFASKPEGWPRE